MTAAGMPRELAAGLGRAGGPMWTDEGRLLVTAMPLGLVCEIDPHHGGVLDTVDTGGVPSGLCQAPDGRIWVAQNGGTVVPSRSARRTAPGLQAIDDARITVMVAGGLRAPDDVIADRDGRLWFTDPGASAGHGRVLVFDPETGELAIVAEYLDHPAGLVFHGNTLLVGESGTGQVLRVAPGCPRPTGRSATGGLGGFALLADGSLLAAVPSACLVAVFDPGGTPATPIRLGAARPTGVCLAGDEHEWLIVTTTDGRVLAMDRSAIPERTCDAARHGMLAGATAERPRPPACRTRSSRSRSGAAAPRWRSG